ncbi:hypothetical protein C8J57DRAFT_1721075 [Mycena rebaudengoi]|nr:hypothetical protein C8J57DRAFT_1721075 [Mycena rebaudengoi]
MDTRFRLSSLRSHCATPSCSSSPSARSWSCSEESPAALGLARRDNVGKCSAISRRPSSPPRAQQVRQLVRPRAALVDEDDYDVIVWRRRRSTAPRRRRGVAGSERAATQGPGDERSERRVRAMRLPLRAPLGFDVAPSLALGEEQRGSPLPQPPIRLRRAAMFVGNGQRLVPPARRRAPAAQGKAVVTAPPLHLRYGGARPLLLTGHPASDQVLMAIPHSLVLATLALDSGYVIHPVRVWL